MAYEFYADGTRNGKKSKTYTVIPDRDVVRIPLEPDLKGVILANLRE
jgi:hypothetical protein